MLKRLVSESSAACESRGDDSGVGCFFIFDESSAIYA
jgi:hypothetical protein